MGLRSEEPDRTTRLRATYAARFALAKRALDFAEGFFDGATLETNEAAVVLLAFYRRIVASLWGIVILAERGLPISALAREVLNSVISVAYISAGVSESEAVNNVLDAVSGRKIPIFGQGELATERAQRCIEYSPAYTVKTETAQLYLSSLSASLVGLLGEERFSELTSRKETWAGRSLLEMAHSLEGPAWREEMPRKVYNTATACLEFLQHGLSVKEVLASASAVNSNAPAVESLRKFCAASGDAATKSDPFECFDAWYLMAACYWTVAALQLIGKKLGIDRQSQLDLFYGEIEQLWRSTGD